MHEEGTTVVRMVDRIIATQGVSLNPHAWRPTVLVRASSRYGRVQSLNVDVLVRYQQATAW